MTWLANETYATFLLSVAYPLLWNISLLHNYRHPTNETVTAKSTTTSTVDPSKEHKSGKDTNGYGKVTTMKKTKRVPLREKTGSDDNVAKNKSKPDVATTSNSSSSSSSSSLSSFFFRTTPATTSDSTGTDKTKTKTTTTTTKASSRLLRSTAATRAKTRSKETQKDATTTTTTTAGVTDKTKRKNAAQRSAAASMASYNGVYDVREEANFWLHYWIVLALFAGATRLSTYTPIVGRILSRSVWVKTSLAELELAFYVWIFGLPSVLTSTSTTEDDFRKSYETRPLQLIINRLKPVVIKTYEGTSGIIPESTWKALSDKANSFLELAVMMRLLSKERRDQLIHALEHSHPVLIPAITLLMPGFTKYGILYITTIVTTARSSPAVNGSLDRIMGRLEYWVLHIVVAGLLNWWKGLLWWIPFSGHAIFFLWCHLQTPKVTEAWYDVFEQELQAFGLLRGAKKDTTVKDTVTAAVIQRIVNSLPSANDSDDNNGQPPTRTDDDDDDNDNINNNSGGTEKQTLLNGSTGVKNDTTTTVVIQETKVTEAPPSIDATDRVGKTTSDDDTDGPTTTQDASTTADTKKESDPLPAPRRSTRLQKKSKAVET